MVFLSICTAQYDYSPQADNELELKEGELVYILDKSDEDDWWKAKKRAPSEDEEEPVGLVPNNYVEEAQPTHHAKALYDYSRQTEEELSFSEGALLSVYDNTSDPEWSLVGLDGEYGFAPANYIEITGPANVKAPSAVQSPRVSVQSPPSSTQEPEPEPAAQSRPAPNASRGPEAALAGIMHKKSASTDSPTSYAASSTRRPQFTPESSEEDELVPSLPRRPPSEVISPSVTQFALQKAPESPGIASSPPYNRVVSQNYDEDQMKPNAGGYHLYNINEMVSVMGKSKKLPTLLGLNLATGQIMIAPEKSRDGPQVEWTADKLTHYSIEGKHVFVELVKPSKSIDFHAGAKDTAKEIVAGLGEIAGASRAEGLREVLAAAESRGSQKKGQVLYDFMAQGDDEVTVAIGDDVIVLDDTKSDEWWMVRRLKNGKEGVVPSSYVEITGIVSPAPISSGFNAGKSVVQQNRLEEERMAKEAVKSNQRGSEVGPGVKLPTRGSSLTSGDNGNQASQRSKKESKSHGRNSSTSKSKPDISKTRTWTDRSGSFKVEAQFIGLKDGKIHLHKLNGVKIAVPVVKMAIEDLEYVEAVTGQSLDDDKPLSEVRKNAAKSQKKPDVPKAGASVEPSKPKPDNPEYDWFDFFLKAGVSPYQCERYASNFIKDSMDENVLSDITPPVLRTLGLKEGDTLRVMKYLDLKFNRTDQVGSPDGGLFAGPGGALKNNTRKGRPAPPVQSSDVVDDNAFKPKESEEEKAKAHTNSRSTPLSPAPPPPKKDTPGGFDDDAWDVKPSKQQPATSQVPKPAAPAQPTATSAPPQQSLSGSLLDLSLLSPPLQPTPAQNPQAPVQHQQLSQTPQQIPRQQVQQPLQQQPTGANPNFFSQLGQPQMGQLLPQNTAQIPPQLYNGQQNFQSQQQQPMAPPRQRPQAPPTASQGSLLPPPPARPLSAPQTQPPSNAFGPPPLQPQLTGFQPQNQFQNAMVPPGQSLNELNQQRLQNIQQLLQPQQTGFAPGPNFGPFNPGLMPQPTGVGQQQGMQNPYVNGQLAGSPFADPRTQSFQQLQPQPTGYQPQFQGGLQPQPTGINSMLAPALQPQNTGINGYSRPGFGQPPPPVPPLPPMPSQAPAAPLVPQQTGPAPPVRFGRQPAKALVPQPTGRKANLSAATPSNPFGF